MPPLAPLSTTSWASEPPQRIHLAPRECAKVDLECYDATNARLLLETLVERRLKAEVTEAQLAEALGTISVLQATIDELEARLLSAKANLDLERTKRKGYLEDHVRLCLGIGGVYNPITGDAEAGAAGVFGWAW